MRSDLSHLDPYLLPHRGRIPRPPAALVGGRPEDLEAALKTLAR
jgi:hypothetical protein